MSDAAHVDDAVRTPFGTFDGALAGAVVDEVVLGTADGAGEEAR